MYTILEIKETKICIDFKAIYLSMCCLQEYEIFKTLKQKL